MELVLQAFAHVFAPMGLIIIIFGVSFGLLLGAIPGLTATMAVGLMIPLTFGLPPELAFPLLLGLYVGGISGGLVSATLVGIPGTPSSVATVFDAYEMARKGEPGKAMGIGVTSSTFGGLLSGVALVTIAPVLARYALKFGPFEFTTLFLLTFACATAVTGESRIKGYLSLIVGILLSMVGVDPINGAERFTFGFYQLSGGLSLLPALIGLFSLAQVIEQTKNTSQSQYAVVEMNTFSYFDYFKTWLLIPKHIFLYLRSSLLGIAIGIFPGIGPGLANVLCYTQAKAGSKHPEKFGTGYEEGIIGAETGNNAATGGALIPLLTLGIPGDTVTSLILAAFMLHGIQPGPLLFTSNKLFIYIIFVSFFVANIIMYLLLTVSSRVFIKALSVPNYILSPVLLVFCAVGSFALNNRVFDIWVFLFFGLLGFIFKKLDIPLLPILMGLILGSKFETEFRGAIIVGKGSLLPFFTRPISLVLIVISVFLVIFLNKLNKRSNPTNG